MALYDSAGIKEAMMIYTKGRLGSYRFPPELCMSENAVLMKGAIFIALDIALHLFTRYMAVLKAAEI